MKNQQADCVEVDAPAADDVASGIATRAAVLRGFAELPDDARVGWAVVAALNDCSEATVWRLVRKGLLPTPERHGRRHTRWVVGQLRSQVKVAA